MVYTTDYTLEMVYVLDHVDRMLYFLGRWVSITGRINSDER